MHHETTLELVGNIYDATLHAELWPETLVSLSNAVGGVQECIQAMTATAASPAMIAPRRDPSFVARFHDHFAFDGERNGCKLFIDGLLAAPPGQMLDTRQFLDPCDFSRTGFHNDWWRPQGLGHATLLVKFTAGDSLWGICGIHRSSRNDDFTGDETALFAAMAPHLARALSIQHKLARLTVEQMSRSGAGKGIILLDAKGRVIFADEGAIPLFEANRGLRIEAGRLTAADPDIAATLGRLVASCAEPSLGNGGPGGTLVLPRNRDAAPARIDVLPAGKTALQRDFRFFGLFRAAVILLISDPAQRAEAQRKRLQETYGLTPAEADFTLEILKGDGRRAAAARKGISLATARTHLSRIFDKTGVRRQAELVRLLSKDER